MITHDFVSLGSQTQLVARLKQLVGFSSSLIILSGATGAGKSTISLQLINELESSIPVRLLNFSADMPISRQRELIVQGIQPNAVFDAEESLVDSLSRLLPNPQIESLFIIDGADLVDGSVYLELWQWLAIADQLAPKHKISILLLGNSEFSNHLAQHLKGREQMALEVEVEPLTQKEQQKLLVSCLQGTSLTSEQKSEIQFSLSQIAGLPADVIAIAEAYMDERKPAKPSTQFKLPISGNKALAGVAVLAGAALLLSLVMPAAKKESEEAKSDTAVRQEATLQPEANTIPVTPVEETISSAEPVMQEAVVANGHIEGMDAETPDDETDKTRVVISDQAIQQMSAQNAESSTSNTSTPVANDSHDVTSPEQLKPIVEEIKGDSQKNIVQEDNKPATKVEAVPVTKPVEKKIVKKTTAVKPKTVVAKPRATVTTSTSGASASGKGFALQLAASGNQTALKQLAAKNGLTAKTYIYKNSSTGMYVLIYGDYASSVAAKSNIVKLPATIQALKPWPKSYAQVRKEQTK